MRTQDRCVWLRAQLCVHDRPLSRDRKLGHILARTSYTILKIAGLTYLGIVDAGRLAQW